MAVSTELQAYAGRLVHNSAIYAYEQPQDAALSAPETALFRRNTAAWAYFEACPPSYRKPVLHRIVTAKKADTRARRLQL